MASKKIGALWLRKTKGGEQYMSGVISDLRGDIQIVCFRNTKKEKQNHPDFNIVLSEPREEKRSDNGGIEETPAVIDVEGSGPEGEIKPEDLPF